MKRHRKRGPSALLRHRSRIAISAAALLLVSLLVGATALAVARDRHPSGSAKSQLAKASARPWYEPIKVFGPPPAGFDPLTATNAQLEAYGFPPRPPGGAVNDQGWLQAIEHAKYWSSPTPLPGGPLHGSYRGSDTSSPAATVRATAAATPTSTAAPNPLPGQLAELVAPDGTAGDQFGGSVALSGDTALIGAYGRTIKGQRIAGLAYVFVHTTTGWSLQAELKAVGASVDIGDGTSVALFGNTALIGAPGKIVGGRRAAGAAYVFVRVGRRWSEQAELTASDLATGDNFGSSLALFGNTALIGAPGKTIGRHTGVGAAYVFVRSGTHWSQQAELRASNPDVGHLRGHLFGASVALSGTTALIGFPQKGSGGQLISGAACIFTRTGRRWSQQAELSASDATAGDVFGTSVALAGNTALIGAYYHKAVASQVGAGAAYVFARSGGRWSQQAELSASDAASSDGFGWSVALFRDTALISAPYKNVGGQYRVGAAYVFGRSGTSWSQRHELSGPAPIDWFGYSVSLSSHTALVGALEAVDHHGAVYVVAPVPTP